MTIGWIFPKNNNGPITGIGEAGVETFKGSPFDSLAREICQNSLDAKLNNNEPVVVEFSEFKLSRNKLNSVDQLMDAFIRSIDFWKGLNDRKTVEFFKNAIQIIDKEEITVLRVSDFNTTGLTGSNQEYGTAWYNLVKSSGVSDKGGASGGSYGIGKSAPYACSNLRTIYYSTLDINGLVASQGVSRLVTFKDSEGDTTYGTGYYGNSEKVTPIEKPLFLDPNYTRTSSGTDIYILGFQNDNGWKIDMIKAVIDGYLIAIYEGKIKVIVGDEEISKDTLGLLMEKYKDKLKTTYNYYQVLISEDTQEFIYEMNGLGKFSLKVLLNPGFHRKILVSRINGMKLFDKANISSTIYFAGILRLIDEPVNEFFRLLEPPEHNSWEFERVSNKKLAKERIKEINKFMKDTVIEFGKVPSSDEVDAEGVGDYLPDDVSLLDDNQNKSNKEPIKQEIKSIVIESKEKPIPSSGFNNDGLKDIDEEINDVGKQDDEGEYFEDNKNEDSKSSGTDDETEAEAEEEKIIDDDTGNKDIRKTVTVKTSNVRLFLTDIKIKKYKIIFTPEDSFDEGYIQVNIASEDGRLKAKLDQAILEWPIGKRSKVESKKIFGLFKTKAIPEQVEIRDLAPKELNIEGNRILINEISAKEKIKISFNLDYSEACSLEVKFYGYQK